jgi:hypothetical protein
MSMIERTRGTTIIAQAGIVVQDVEAKARAWAEILGLPVSEKVAHLEAPGLSLVQRGE